jgi:hypothetical protein
MDMNALQNSIQQGLNTNGGQRFIKPSDIPTKTWKDIIFKDFEFEADVDITGENHDKQAVMSALSGVLTIIASNPAILADPNAQLIFTKIVNETGVLSALELSQIKQPTAMPVGGVGAVPVVAQK